MLIVARGAFLATALAVALPVVDGGAILRAENDRIAGNVRRGSGGRVPPPGGPLLLLPLEEGEETTLTLPSRRLDVATTKVDSSEVPSGRSRIARVAVAGVAKEEARPEVAEVAFPKVAFEHRIFPIPSSSSEILTAARELTTECPDYSKKTCTSDAQCTCSSSTADKEEVRVGDPPQSCWLCKEPQPPPPCPSFPSCSLDDSCHCDEGGVKMSQHATTSDGTRNECHYCHLPRECPTFPECSYEEDCYCDSSSADPLLSKTEALTDGGQVCYACHEEEDTEPAANSVAATTAATTTIHEECPSGDECGLNPNCRCDDTPGTTFAKLTSTTDEVCYGCRPVYEECPNGENDCGFNPDCKCDDSPGKSFVELTSTTGKACYACRSPPKCSSDDDDDNSCSYQEGCVCDVGTSRKEVESSTGDYCLTCVGGDVECPSEGDACSWLSECGCDASSELVKKTLTTDAGDECWSCRSPECPSGNSCSVDESCVCNEPSTKEEFTLGEEHGGGVCYGCREESTPTATECPLGSTSCTPDETCHCDSIAESTKRAIQSTDDDTCYQCHVPSVCPTADDCSPESDCYCDSSTSDGAEIAPIEFVSTIGDKCYGCPSETKLCPGPTDGTCTRNYLCRCDGDETKTEYNANGGGVCFACTRGEGE